MKWLKLILTAAVAGAVFSGCTFRKVKPAEEMPDDKPWNRIVMETDSGYYYPTDTGVLSLRYTEKSNGADIFLCAKPECAHEGGEDCTATYKFLYVSNYVLYDGYIYFVADTSTEETQGFTLYRESLDGTSLDKAGDVIKVKHKLEDDAVPGKAVFQRFIIHKGYAYIPYNICQGFSYSDFIEDGLVRMDIQTGKTEIMHSNKSYTDSMDITMIGGIEDFVYYKSYSRSSIKKGYYRYDIKSGRSEKLSGEAVKLIENDEAYSLSGITGDSIYLMYDNEGDSCELQRFNAQTLEPDGFRLKITDGNERRPDVKYYDDKIIIFREYGVEVYSAVNGELMGSKLWRKLPERESEEEPRMSVGDISNGKVYVGFYSAMEIRGMEFDRSTYDENGSLYFLECGIEDIVRGEGEWGRAFTVGNMFKYWRHPPGDAWCGHYRMEYF